MLEGGSGMRNAAIKTVTLGLCVALLVSCQCSVSAEPYTFTNTSGQWTTTCNLEEPQGFTGDIYQYQYKQQTKQAQSLQDSLSSALQSSLTFTSNVDNKAHLYSRKEIAMTVPTFVSNRALLTDEEQALTEAFAEGLQRAGFACCAEPYLCAKLDTVYQEASESAIGQLPDWSTYERRLHSGNGDSIFTQDDTLVVFAAEVNGYPILPSLFGDYSDSDVPMFALAVIQQGQIVYVEIGCSYEITKERKVESTLVDWRTAADTAMQKALTTWQPALDSLSTQNTAGFDYAGFFEKYQPSFTLSAESMQACYYASNGILRPGWQVHFVLTVHLENADGLMPADIHHYLPEVVRYSYVVDALTGDVVI